MMKKPWSMASCQAVVPTEASVIVRSTDAVHQELQGLRAGVGPVTITE